MPGEFYAEPIPLVCPECGHGLTAARADDPRGQQAANVCINEDCRVNTVTVTLYGPHDRTPENLAQRAIVPETGLPVGGPNALAADAPIPSPVKRDARGRALP